MDQPAIIIDIGSCTVKCGVSTSQTPTLEVPSLVEGSSPINCGIITDWDKIEKLFSQVLTSLNISPENRDVLITDPIFYNNFTDYENKMYPIFFEKFGVNSFKYECASICAMEANGKETGMVINSGFGYTSFFPVMDGNVVVAQNGNVTFGGDNVTKYLMEQLKKKGKVDLNPANKDDYKIANDIKEKVVYVAQDYYGEIGTVEEIDYDLPDGRKIKLKEERIDCIEPLFSLDKVNMRENEDEGIPAVCKETIDKINIYRRKDMYSYMLFTGGNTLFKGFETRFANDLKAIIPPAMANRLVIEAQEDRRNLIYKGASIKAGNTEYRKKWLTKKKYQEGKK